MISIVLPTHNRPAELKAALDSLCAQSLLPGEVIVVDDGSTPAVSAADIFGAFPESVSTILLRNPRAMGANHARNRGVRQATGEFIAFLDDDDRFKPHKLATLKRAVLEHKDVDVIYHPAHIHMRHEGVSYFSSPQPLPIGPERIRALLMGNPVGGTAMVAIRRSSIIEVGYFDEDFPALQDRELYMRLAQSGCNFLLIPEPLTDYYHTTNQGSISKSIEHYLLAQKLFEEKYQEEFALLNESELKILAITKLKGNPPIFNSAFG